MTPSETLAEVRRLVSAVLCADEDADIGVLAEELALTVDSLDEMLTSGMLLPIDWDEV